MKKPFTFTTLLLFLVILTAGPAHSSVNWLEEDAHSYAFSVTNNKGEFYYVPRGSLSVNDAEITMLSNENGEASDPYDSIAEGAFTEFGDYMGGKVRVHAMAMGPDQDGAGNAVNPANGLKVQAFAQVVPEALDATHGIHTDQDVTSWTTRWFTLDQTAEYQLKAELEGDIQFNTFYSSNDYYATNVLRADVVLNARVVTDTGGLASTAIFSSSVTKETPVSTTLTLSPTDDEGRYITYELMIKLDMASEINNIHWGLPLSLGGTLSGPFNIGTQENPIALTATVACYHDLTTYVDGDGGALLPDSGRRQENEIVALTATPDPGYRVAKWSGTDYDDSTANTNTVTMGGDRTVSVSFEAIPTYTLEITAPPGAMGSVTIVPEQEFYEENTEVTLTAEAYDKYQFIRWDGLATDQTNASITVTMNRDYVITPVFEEIPVTTYELSLTVLPEGAGTVIANPAQDLYGENTVVTLTAAANMGYLFEGWDGAVTDENASPTTIRMERNQQVVARFLENPDDDTDGVDDLLEQGPDQDNPDYDGNNDGIPDHLQSNVVSMPTHDGQHYVTLACDPAHALKEVSSVAPVAGGPSDLEFPYGFFDFKIDGVDPGGSTYLNIILPEEKAPNSYYKVGPTPEDASDHWYEFLNDGTSGASLEGNTITLSFVDGKRGDDDLTADGVIIDQGGPSVQVTQSSQVIEPESSSSDSSHACFISVAGQ